MDYRLAKRDDIEVIMEITRDAIMLMESQGIFQWDDIYPTAEYFMDDIMNDSLYVVTNERRIIGMYMLSGDFDDAYAVGNWLYSSETACSLHRFCLSPNHQNKRLGKQVLSHIESQARNMGYESMRLDVFAKNPIAQNLYRNNGYEVRGMAKWRKGYFELMEKKLLINLYNSLELFLKMLLIPNLINKYVNQYD